MPVLDFEICACPECGSVSVGRKICRTCGTSTIITSLMVQDIVIGNVGDTKSLSAALDALSAKLCDSTKRAMYAQKKEIDRKESSKNTWRLLKRNIRVCPQCGHIAGASCFYDNNICCICGTAYLDGGINSRKYYARDEESDTYIEKKQAKLREKLCVKNAYYNKTMWQQRIDIEKDRLPIRLETQLINHSSLSSMGFIPALLNMPGKISIGKQRIWDIFIALQCYILKYVALLDNATEGERAGYLAQFRELLSDTFNILRSQSFLGQQDAVNIMNAYIADLDRQISSQV